MSAAKRGPQAVDPDSMDPLDTQRRDEILDTASSVFASSGLRTTLQEIAEASGIQPGSLYHHFESKEAIVVELVKRYHADLDRQAEIALKELRESAPDDLPDRITAFSTAIAQCAVRHSAAVQFSFYDPPVSAGHELVRLVARAPTATEKAMLKTLEAGHTAGFLRDDIELRMLSHRLTQTMLHIGLGLVPALPVRRPGRRPSLWDGPLRCGRTGPSGQSAGRIQGDAGRRGGHAVVGCTVPPRSRTGPPSSERSPELSSVGEAMRPPRSGTLPERRR